MTTESNRKGLSGARADVETIKARPSRRLDRDDEDDLNTVEADIDSFFESNDEQPGDRRRDPLRRGW